MSHDPRSTARDTESSRSTLARPHRRSSFVTFALVLCVVAGTSAFRRGERAEFVTGPTRVPLALDDTARHSAARPDEPASNAALTCGEPDSIPVERLQALATGLYPEIVSEANRHKSLTVALLFDAGCHLKAHALTRRKGAGNVEAVLGATFPTMRRGAWTVSGIADAGPWTFELGAPNVVWAVLHQR